MVPMVSHRDTNNIIPMDLLLQPLSILQVTLEGGVLVHLPLLGQIQCFGNGSRYINMSFFSVPKAAAYKPPPFPPPLTQIGPSTSKQKICPILSPPHLSGIGINSYPNVLKEIQFILTFLSLPVIIKKQQGQNIFQSALTVHECLLQSTFSILVISHKALLDISPSICKPSQNLLKNQVQQYKPGT